MPMPSEPLLPVEPETPSRLKLWLVLAGAALAAVASMVGLFAGRGTRPSPAEAPVPESAARSGTRPPKTESAATPVDPSLEASEERRAKDLYDAAEAFERTEPGD